MAWPRAPRMPEELRNQARRRGVQARSVIHKRLQQEPLRALSVLPAAQGTASRAMGWRRDQRLHLSCFLGPPLPSPRLLPEPGARAEVTK